MNRRANMCIRYITKDISVFYKIFQEIYSKAPPILKDLSNDPNYKEWKEWIDGPIDFQTIDQNIKENQYSSITDVVKDVRVVFLNCYKYYGINSDHTMKSLELEELFENKLSALDNDLYKAFADITLTILWLRLNEIPKSNVSYPKGCYESKLLKYVAHNHPGPLKKENDKLPCSTTNKDKASVKKPVTNPVVKEEIISNKPKRFVRSCTISNYRTLYRKYEEFFESESSETSEDSDPEDEWGAIHKIKISKKPPK